MSIQEIRQNISTKGKKLDQIRLLVRLLDSLIADEKELRKLAPKNINQFQKMSCSPISAGHFYELTLIEHTLIFFYLAGLTDFLKKVTTNPEMIEQAIEDEQVEPPEWMNLDDYDARFGTFFAALYTLNKSINAIKSVGKPINQLLEEGFIKDRSLLKLAVKLDPVAITSPTISASLMLSDLMGKRDARTDMSSALKKPYKRRIVSHPRLQYVVRAMHDDGLLSDMSEEERYEFFCEDLGLYPATGEDPFQSLNRLIRRWEKKFRT